MSIKIENLSFAYEPDSSQPVYALENINLTIEDGEFIGIIGHTGSGKSTLTQHLNGLLKATAGILYYNGENIYEKSYSMKYLRQKVGLVFQYPEHQLFEATVFKDVCFGPKNMGMDKNEAELKAFAALEKVHFPTELFYQSPFDMSGGQKRRAAIAGVLAMEPEVLILDEPTAGLDPQGRNEIWKLISDLREKEKITVIVVSHSMEDMAEHVNRLIVMNDGKVMFDDIPGKVFLHYKELEAVGLKAPEVSYIMQELLERGFLENSKALTMDEAKTEILNAYKKRRQL